MTTRIADVHSAALLPDADGVRPYDNIQWVSVLKSMTAYQMYRRSEQIRVQRGPVLRFIFKNPQFPRSVRWCIEHARLGLERLPRNEASLREVGRLVRLLDGADLPALSQAELHHFVDDVQLGIAALHGEIAATWFPPPLAIEEAA
jgi:uncharacterized alpha-E superfamily protein